ncbi:MAG: hypothetical protein P0111_18265 [Nitrospira sp.]|nr:hypothetical protein [Nitrospira sp.]
MTILVFAVVLLVLGFCGIWYWGYVETQTLHLQERNFRALTVTGQSLADRVANYEKVLGSIVEGNPCYRGEDRRCPENDRHKAYEKALRELQGFKADVMVTKAAYEDEGLTAKLVRDNGASYIKLRYVHQDRMKTKWKIEASVDIGTVMRPLVTEEIFSDVLLADRMGRVLYHQPSRRDPSGFEFDNVSSLLHRLNDPSRRDGGAEKSSDKGTNDVVSTLPLFNDTRIGDVPYTIYAQAAVLPAQKGATQPLILVGIVPAGQFHAEARAIPLNHLLLVAGLLLTLFFVLPYVKLVATSPTERLTPISVTILIVSSLLGTALLTFGLAAFATYHNLEQHLNVRLKTVSEDIRKRVQLNVEHALQQLAAFDESCDSKLDCWRRLRNPAIEPKETDEPHLAQRLCIAVNAGGDEKGFSFFSTASDTCSEHQRTNGDAHVVFPDVNTIFWVGSTGELKVLRSREPDPWKHVNLKERQYVRRIWEDETFTGGHDGRKFWIQSIYSWTTGNNYAVLSLKSTASSERDNLARPIVAALEVRLPSVTGVGVPPGMGFAVINQDGEVLFHSDSRRNLRENLFEETDREAGLRQAVFARATTQLDGRYWGKDRHFHIAPLFLPKEIHESPDVHWSLVTYWDRDMLRGLNLRALYSSGALFFIYAIISLSIGILGWWIYSRVNVTASLRVWPQSEHRHQLVLVLLVASLIAVGIWYVRPHSYPDMLLWGLLPPFVAAVAVWFIIQTDPRPTGHDKTDVSARRRYGRSYGLLVTAGLLAFVVIPALVIFRVAVDVEWRLLAKFALFDLDSERRLQAQKVRESYPSTVFHNTDHTGEVRTEFIREFSDSNTVSIDFPFQPCLEASQNCQEAPTNVVQRGDERLIRWLHQVIDRPRIGYSRDETEMFLETPEQWHEPKWGTLGFKDQYQGTVPPINLYSITSPIPPWLYSLLVFGCLIPLAALRARNTYAFAAVICVLGGSLWFGLVGEAFALLAVIALIYGAWYVLPMFAAQRVLPMDLPHPSMDSTAGDERKGTAEMVEHPKPPDGWSSGLWDLFAREISGLRNGLRLTGIPWSNELTKSHETILKRDIEEDFEVVKERLIREILEAAQEQYMQIWEKCTESQRRSLFNLARDGFLHTRNPDIGPLLKRGLIVGDLNLRPMNKSFRRFVIIMGLKEHLDEDAAQTRTSPWFQVSRPIGAGLLLIMVFLVLTQEQYRAITLAFLGVLPGLLGAFSPALTAHKREA